MRVVLDIEEVGRTQVLVARVEPQSPPKRRRWSSRSGSAPGEPRPGSQVPENAEDVPLVQETIMWRTRKPISVCVVSIVQVVGVIVSTGMVALLGSRVGNRAVVHTGLFSAAPARASVERRNHCSRGWTIHGGRAKRCASRAHDPWPHRAGGDPASRSVTGSSPRPAHSEYTMDRNGFIWARLAQGRERAVAAVPQGGARGMVDQAELGYLERQPASPRASSSSAARTKARPAPPPRESSAAADSPRVKTSIPSPSTASTRCARCGGAGRRCRGR